MTESPRAAVEEAGVGFDPTTQALDLTKDEKRRTTALMLAIQAYRELIIKEADYLREASNLARSGNGPTLTPATIDAMLEAAVKFDWFIAGAWKVDAGPPADADVDPDAESGGRARCWPSTAWP